MTPIESLINRILPFIDRTRVSDVELHGIVEEHLIMEKENLDKLRDFDAWKEWKNKSE
jgi:hypothetical protein